LGLFIFLFLTQIHFSYSQSINFQGTGISMPYNIDSVDLDAFPENSKDNFGYYGWMRFGSVPNQSIQDELKQKNYKLISYYPHNVYLSYLPAKANLNFLKQIGVECVIPLGINQKMSKTVRIQQFPDWALNQNKVLLSFNYFENFGQNQIYSVLAKYNSIDIIKQYKFGNIIDISIPISDIESFTSENIVKWIDVVAPPSVKDDVLGRSLHRSSNLDTGNPNGRQYTGEGVGVMVRDDGMVGPHIDFQGRLNNISTTNDGGTHGDGVAGIMAGAGNLNPLNKGMASGSDVYVVDYVSNFLDTSTVDKIISGEVQITNSSFSNGCNTGYTQVANTVDQQTNTYPQLLHVFSAGNSGTEDCGYGAGAGWGNITGGHKIGKNVIATANVFSAGGLVNSSSRGPSTDGRIKPDITAHGQGQISTDENNSYLTFGGTSGAAPGIAGVAAQLYQAYSDLNNGTLPESALIKAALMNTANDYGHKGPDFSYGWGIVNGLRAAMLLENGHFLDNSISQSEDLSHNITIPSNTKKVKIMLYWSDKEGSPGASPALVNDLDLSVQDPLGNTNLPYLLDPTPNASNLDTPATNGFDRLNNVEQVEIDDPVPGTYNINVSGFNIPFGPQKYYIVYDIIEEGLTITYPTGDDILVSNTQDIIHWDGYNLIGNTTIEYSSDNGSTWLTVGIVPAVTKSLIWNVPNEIGGEYLVRVSNNGISAISQQSFSIAPRVDLITFLTVCPNEATITWSPIFEAGSYDIYTLGNKHMELVGNTTDLSYSIPISDPTEDIWVAVSANGPAQDPWKSIRSNAVLYNNGDLLNCPLNIDLSVVEINNVASDFTPICNPSPAIISANITNGSTSPKSNFTLSYQLNNEPIVEELFTNTLNPGEIETYTFNNPLADNYQNGANVLKVWTSINGDEYLQNNEKVFEFTAFTSGTLLDFSEDFESSPALPTAWQLFNPDNDVSWEPVGIDFDPSGNPTQAFFIDNYFYDTNGEQDTIETEYFDLNFNGTPELRFDLAKAQFSSDLNDGLRVEISLDCGQTYQEIYFKEDLVLSTVPNYVSSFWQPASNNDWRTEIIDLTPYLGNDVLLRFSNVNGYGNSTFIDNINLIKNETLSISDNPLDGAIKLYPNPTSDLVNLEINTNYGNQYSIKLNNILGQTIWESRNNNLNRIAKRSIDLMRFESGVYFLTIQIDDASVVKKLIKR
jgi:subtilisin family serine protease